jgi:hypothetical protein
VPRAEQASTEPALPGATRLGAPAFFARLKRALGQILYGATGYEFEREAGHVRANLENLFVFMIMGDTIGVPVLPPYYSLRLVPYLVPTVEQWKRRVLRERDPLEREEFDLHGL